LRRRDNCKQERGGRSKENFWDVRSRTHLRIARTRASRESGGVCF
jgi:hypothetical protein